MPGHGGQQPAKRPGARSQPLPWTSAATEAAAREAQAAARRRSLTIAGLIGLAGLMAVVGLAVVLVGLLSSDDVPATQPASAAASAQAEGQSPSPTGSQGELPFDPLGRWQGSSVGYEGDRVHQVTVELIGDPAQPAGTVTVRDLDSGSEAAWNVTGNWDAAQLQLAPQEWADASDGDLPQELLVLVALGEDRLSGTTADPAEPSDPTGELDLYRGPASAAAS